MSFKVGDKVGLFIPGEVIGLRKSGHALIQYASITAPSRGIMQGAREWIEPNGSRWKNETPTVFHLEDLKNMKINEE